MVFRSVDLDYDDDFVVSKNENPIRRASTFPTHRTVLINKALLDWRKCVELRRWVTFQRFGSHSLEPSELELETSSDVLSLGSNSFRGAGAVVRITTRRRRHSAFVASRSCRYERLLESGLNLGVRGTAATCVGVGERCGRIGIAKTKVYMILKCLELAIIIFD